MAAAAIIIPQKTLIVSLPEYRAVHIVSFAAKPIAANRRPSNGTCARRIPGSAILACDAARRHPWRPWNRAPGSSWTLLCGTGAAVGFVTPARDEMSPSPKGRHSIGMASHGEVGLAGSRPFHQTIELPSDIIERRLLEFVGGRPVHQRFRCARLHIVVNGGASDRQHHADDQA